MSNKPVMIAPSILSADFAQLGKAVSSVERAGAEWLHIDVMDGHFVPNISIGPVVVKSLRRYSKMLFDVHLMITNPEKYWESFAAAGADSITIHYESEPQARALLRTMKKAGLKVGLSIKPKTPLSRIMPLLPLLDVVLIMSVEPGFGGQSFMGDMMSKVAGVREYIVQKKLKCFVQVDGGINAKTASVAVAAGADVLVAGNAVFAGKYPGKAVKIIKKSAISLS